MVTPLGKLGSWRHVVVGGTIGATTLAAGLGIIGEDHAERFDAKQVVVSPVGTDGLHVREVVDQDFGNRGRHGYERLIPNDFGVPVEVTAESGTAPDGVDVEQIGGQTRIRIGDPSRTITGQHRYVLEYTYPVTMIDSGLLALDVIGTDETLETERFEVVITGLEVDDPLCNVGGPDASGGCELVRDGDVYRAVVAPLEAGDGITIGGTIVGRLPVVDVPLPPEPDPQANRRGLLAAVNAVLGTAAAAGVYAGRGAAAATRCSPAVPPMPPSGRRCRHRRRRRKLPTNLVPSPRHRASDRWRRCRECGWSQTIAWTNWRPPSSSHRQGSTPGSATCC